jgi:hypothetical protein
MSAYASVSHSRPVPDRELPRLHEFDEVDEDEEEDVDFEDPDREDGDSDEDEDEDDA